MEVRMTPDTQGRVAALLRDAETAHGAYETAVLGGQRDSEWAAWYATYLLDHGIADLVAEREFDRDGLAAMLVVLDEEFRSRPRSEAWPDYYAQRLLATSG
jgi:hypothetical protein